jgi:O-methyltransferase
LFSEIIGYPSARVHYVKGWFQETVAREATHIPEIAILRLDGDWYESTRVCLEAFYPLLSKGGICIIDDYGYNSGCKKAVDEYLRSINSHPLMARVGYLRYWIKV